MKRIVNFIVLPGLLLICVIGITAAFCGLDRLEAWCRRQL
jgi:hypothetical protein